MLKTKKWCHSERSEEPEYISYPKFLAALGMTQLLDIQCILALAPANAKMCTYASKAIKYRFRELASVLRLRNHIIDEGIQSLPNWTVAIKLQRFSPIDIITHSNHTPEKTHNYLLLSFWRPLRLAPKTLFMSPRLLAN